MKLPTQASIFFVMKFWLNTQYYSSGEFYIIQDSDFCEIKLTMIHAILN
jgi:hypothetical protein